LGGAATGGGREVPSGQASQNGVIRGVGCVLLRRGMAKKGVKKIAAAEVDTRMQGNYTAPQRRRRPYAHKGEMIKVESAGKGWFGTVLRKLKEKTSA